MDATSPSFTVGDCFSSYKELELENTAIPANIIIMSSLGMKIPDASDFEMRREMGS